MRWYPNTRFNIPNRRYFGGRLPKYRVRFVTLPKDWGRVWHLKRLIELSDDFKGKWSQVGTLTLLHEMAHIEDRLNRVRGSGKHARRFDRIMQRLAAAGAFNGLW